MSSFNVAIILSGNGFMDGSECTEAVSTLIHCDKAGFNVQSFAPNKNQFHSINHMKGEEMTETRNVMVEASRITRGKIQPLSDLKAASFDALIIPGGFGVAKVHRSIQYHHIILAIVALSFSLVVVILVDIVTIVVLVLMMYLLLLFV